MPHTASTSPQYMLGSLSQLQSGISSQSRGTSTTNFPGAMPTSRTSTMRECSDKQHKLGLRLCSCRLPVMARRAVPTWTLRNLIPNLLTSSILAIVEHSGFLHFSSSPAPHDLQSQNEGPLNHASFLSDLQAVASMSCSIDFDRHKCGTVGMNSCSLLCWTAGNNNCIVWLVTDDEAASSAVGCSKIHA